MSSQQTTWADPTPVSLFSQAVGVFGVGALMTGIVPALSAAFLIPWFFGISIAVTIAGVIQLKSNDIFGGTVSLLTGAVFLTSGNWASMLLKFVGLPPAAPIVGTLTSVQLPPQIEGFFFAMLAVILIIIGILALRISWVVGVMTLSVAVAIVFAPVIWDFLGQPGVPTDPAKGIENIFAMIAGVLYFIFSLVALYVGTALLIIHATGKVVLPIGKPILK